MWNQNIEFSFVANNCDRIMSLHSWLYLEFSISGTVSWVQYLESWLQYLGPSILGTLYSLLDVWNKTPFNPIANIQVKFALNSLVSQWSPPCVTAAYIMHLRHLYKHIFHLVPYIWNRYCWCARRIYSLSLSLSFSLSLFFSLSLSRFLSFSLSLSLSLFLSLSRSLSLYFSLSLALSRSLSRSLSFSLSLALSLALSLFSLSLSLSFFLSLSLSLSHPNISRLSPRSRKLLLAME